LGKPQGRTFKSYGFINRSPIHLIVKGKVSALYGQSAMGFGVGKYLPRLRHRHGYAQLLEPLRGGEVEVVLRNLEISSLVSDGLLTRVVVVISTTTTTTLYSIPRD
jgi:hypothetical protein